MHSPRRYPYVVVDVFTDVPFEGNPLAVFPAADGLTSGEMQTLANELNLSETSFVLPPESATDAARVRIFTPRFEMPFAGHPTIGTAFVLCRNGTVPAGTSEFALGEGIGSVPLSVESREPFLAWLSTPPIRFEGRYDPAATAAALGLAADDLVGDKPVQVLSAGNPFLYVPLRDKPAVDRAQLDLRALERAVPAAAATGVFVFAVVDGGVYSRMFAPMAGIIEDPATGSATGPLGAYLAEYGFIEKRDGLRFVSEQGVKMGRRSTLQVRLRVRDGRLDTVQVGGGAVAVIEATVTLPSEGVSV